MASLSALKNKAKVAPSKKKATPTKPVKKAAPTKSVAKKTVKKSVAKSPVKKVAPKIPLKKDLSASDVRLILSAQEAHHRHKEVLEELATRGITSLGKIPKNVDRPLWEEARALEIDVPAFTEKLRKLGLGSPSRILSNAQKALVAPPVISAPAVEKVKTEKIDKSAVAKIDGEEVELEEVELEDLDALVAEVSTDEPAEEKVNAPRVVNLAEESSGNEEKSSTSAIS